MHRQPNVLGSVNTRSRVAWDTPNGIVVQPFLADLGTFHKHSGAWTRLRAIPNDLRARGSGFLSSVTLGTSRERVSNHHPIDAFMPSCLRRVGG